MTLSAPKVRPWKAPWKAMIAGRPVARRASFSAPSMASAPELPKKTVSSGSGSVARHHLGQPRDRLVVAHALHQVEQPVGLGVDRGSDRRVAVAEHGHRDAGGEVEVGLAVRVVQAMALAVAPVRSK